MRYIYIYMCVCMYAPFLEFNFFNFVVERVIFSFRFSFFFFINENQGRGINLRNPAIFFNEVFLRGIIF